MRLASRLTSTIGLLCLVAGIILFPANDGAGGTVLRWDYLVLGLCTGIACFLLAALLSKRIDKTDAE